MYVVQINNITLYMPAQVLRKKALVTATRIMVYIYK